MELWKIRMNVNRLILLYFDPLWKRIIMDKAVVFKCLRTICDALFKA